MSSYPIWDADCPCWVTCVHYALCTLCLWPHTSLSSSPSQPGCTPVHRATQVETTWHLIDDESHGQKTTDMSRIHCSALSFSSSVWLLEFNEKCLANQLCVFILLWMPEFYIACLHYFSNSDRCAGVGCLPSILWKWRLHSRGMKAGTSTWLFSCLG